MRTYRPFSYRNANFRIASDRFDAAASEIVRQREILEAYILLHPEFERSLRPLEPRTDAPDVARRMAAAARAAGVGPMAAVAGAMAQLAAEAALRDGAREAVVENGGDIYLVSPEPVTVGLFAGSARLKDRLAFTVGPADMPLSLCSSSGRMGRSMSLGRCDLATVAASDAALADAAATRAANAVRTPSDVEPALHRIMEIPGVLGVLLVKDDRVGLMGRLPSLVRNPSGLPPELITGR